MGSSFYKIMDIIKSTKNEKIKQLKSLYTKKGRTQSQLFIVEGFNSIKDIPLNCKIDSFYIRDDIEEKKLEQLNLSDKKHYFIDKHIFDSLALTSSPSGIIAVCEFLAEKEFSLNKAIVLDGIQDPGNLGAIIRSCVAFGFNDILGVDCVDLYNPKVVRASMSAIFKVNYVVKPLAEAINYIKEYQLIALDVIGKNIKEFDFKDKIALILGNESKGISKEFLDIAEHTVSIPMTDNIESLNAAVAASIAMFTINNFS